MPERGLDLSGDFALGLLRHGVEAHGVWSAGDVETAIVSSSG